MQVYSACGYHPTEGTLAYSAYQCFASPDEAAEFCRLQSHWSATEVVGHSVVGDTAWIKQLPTAREMFARLRRE